MVAPDTAAHSETHRDSKEKEPVKLGLHASINPDTLPFTYAKDKHALSFTVENTGESVEIFKIKTTASYLYRIRPVFFKLGIRERQEVSVTYKGIDAGPIPLSAKDRITVVFAHALDPRKGTNANWELHKPFAHLSYAESREYVRVLFVDETGRLAVSAAHEKSRGGLERRSIGGLGTRSITARPEPPRRMSAERDMTDNQPIVAEEKSHNADYEDAPSNAPVHQLTRTAAPRTPRSPAVARGAKGARTPSPNSLQSPKETRKSYGGRTRDPIESLLSSVTKDASAIVCVQYPGKRDDEEDDTTKKKDEDTKKRDMDTDDRREEVLRRKVAEMRRSENEERASKKKEEKKRDDERKKKEEEREDRRKKEEEQEERKKKEDEREERRRKEEEKEERKKKEEEREERRRKEEEKDERKKKEEEREELMRKEDERRKKEDEAEAEEKAAALKPRRRTSNEDVKQEAAEDAPAARTPRRRVLGADGHYHDDDSRYLDEEIRRQHASVRLLKKGGRTGSRDNSVEDDKPSRRASLEDDN